MRNLLFYIGNLLIISSGPLIGINGFKGNTFGAVIGFLSLIIGYKILQETTDKILDVFKNIDPTEAVIDSLLIFTGTFLIAKGFVTGALATNNPVPADMMLSGLLFVTGHLTAHLGVNKTLL